MLTDKFKEALLYALDVHRDDLRKGSSIPYISHLLSVCALVMEEGGDEEEAIAALLHDTLEDHPETVTREELRRRFGERVTQMVEDCTDTPADYRGGPKPPWHQRKASYLQKLRTKTYPLCRITLADKLHNARTLVRDYSILGDKLWSRFKAGKTDQIKYYRELIAAFRQLGAPHHAVDELEALIDRLDQPPS